MTPARCLTAREAKVTSKGAAVVRRRGVRCPARAPSGVDSSVEAGGGGGGGGGGDDEFVGKLEPSHCVMCFTEIGQAYDHWSGHVETIYG